MDDLIYTEAISNTYVANGESYIKALEPLTSEHLYTIYLSKDNKVKFIRQTNMKNPMLAKHIQSLAAKITQYS